MTGLRVVSARRGVARLGPLAAAVVALSLGVSPALAAVGPGPNPFAAIPPLPDVPVSAFYQPPQALPKGPLGTIIRSEELPPIPGATVRRLMYVSTDNLGKRVAVTGVVLTPMVAPQNPGPGGARPIVTHLPGTRGLANSCAPSNFYDPTTVVPRNIELAQAPGYVQQLAAGVTVVITDYVGGGTPLAQEYLIARSAAQSGIDATRATLLLDPNDDLNDSSPLAYFGVSQGGQAAAAVAELLPTYGRDLQPRVRGVVAGGVVTDPDVTTLPAWRAAMAKSKLGTIAPQVPTYLFNGSFDTIVPAHMTPQLFNDWCTAGATTEFTSYPGTEHVGSLVVFGIPAANRWVLDRLAGKAVASGCTQHDAFGIG